MRFKRTAAVLTGVLLTAGVAACTSSGSSTTDTTNAAASAESSNSGAGLNLIFTNQPAPIFATSAYRQQLIEIEAVEALGTPTTAFFFPPGWNGTGSHPFKVCFAQGLPIPNSTELDNPDEIVQDPYGGGYQQNQGGIAIPRADPIGVYTPSTGTGTYVTCLGKGGGLEASYWEGDVYAEAAPAEWDTSTGMVQDIGPGALPVCTVETAAKGNPDKIPAGTVYDHCVPKPTTSAHVWGSLTHSGGRTVLTRLDSAVTITVSCSLKQASYYSTKDGKYHKDGITSSCRFPDGTNLTFAPWGVVSSG